MAKRLVFTGDSITDCDRLWDDRPDSLGFGYVRMIAEALARTEPETEVLNRGHNGFTAFQMKIRWEEDCISLSPDVVTILVGINDLYLHIGGAGGRGAEGYALSLEQMIKEVRERLGASLILMEPFVFPEPQAYAAWEEPLGEFRLEMKRLAEQYRTGFVPLWEIFREAGQRLPLAALTTDGIHLTEKGHEIVAVSWLKEYERYVRADDSPE